MEDISTGVLEKINNIQAVKIKPKRDMMSQGQLVAKPETPLHNIQVE